MKQLRIGNGVLSVVCSFVLSYYAFVPHVSNRYFLLSLACSSAVLSLILLALTFREILKKE